MCVCVSRMCVFGLSVVGCCFIVKGFYIVKIQESMPWFDGGVWVLGNGS